MKHYKKVYLDYFGYKHGDYVPDELNGLPSVDVHHINGRGKGKDVIENLIALNRENHTSAHNHEYSKEYLTRVHLKFMKTHGINRGN